MSTGLPWFRMYAEAVDDEKLRLLAFEDRWHYVAILCCKCMGLLDAGDPLPLLRRKMAVKLGLAARELDAMSDRLEELSLIDAETFQPVAWDGRQFKSDTDPTAAERKRRQRQRERGHVDVSRVTVTEVTRTDTDTDTESLPDTSPPPAPSAVGGAFEGHGDAKATPNPAAPLAIALNKAQFKCTSYTPSLVAYVGEGGTLEHLQQVLAVHGAECAGKPAAYVLGIARRERTERATPVTPGAASGRYVAPPPARTTETVEQTRAKLEATKPSKPADPEAAQRAIEEARRFLAMPEPAAREKPTPVSREALDAAERELAAMRDRKSQAAGADA